MPQARRRKQWEEVTSFAERKVGFKPARTRFAQSRAFVWAGLRRSCSCLAVCQTLTMKTHAFCFSKLEEQRRNSEKARFTHQPRFKHYDSSTADSSTRDSGTADSGTTRFTHQRFRHCASPIQAPKRSDSSTRKSRCKHQKEPIQAPKEPMQVPKGSESCAKPHQFEHFQSPLTVAGVLGYKVWSLGFTSRVKVLGSRTGLGFRTLRFGVSRVWV